MASRFSAPKAGTPVFHTFQMYRSYDGDGSAFGDTSVQTTVPNPDTLAAFGALRRKDGALTVMVISKVLSGQTPLTLALMHVLPSGPVQVWQMNSCNVIEKLPSIRAQAGKLTTSLPAQSISLFVVPVHTAL